MFNVLKEEFKANTLKMQQIRAVHERKEKEIRDVYAPGKIPRFLHEEEENYKSAMKKARLDAINQLNASVKKIESAQGGMDSHIDTALLTELNAISASGLGLTASELKNIGQKVLSSGSAICARKLIEIAEMSGIKLTMPDPDKARSVLYECAEELLDFYKHYDGTAKYKTNMSIDEGKYCFKLNGKFIDEHEKKFEAATSSNLNQTKKAVEEAEEDKKEKTLENALNEFRKMVSTEDVPEQKKSDAAEFVKAYNSKMNPSNMPQPQVAFMRPSPGVVSKRVPKPKARPDLTYNTADTPASTAAKELSQKMAARTE
ncbi:unknown [Blautia obeum CAG:39]|jgi:hypothetical protein|nr:unknown [Blautia obeum CAG:39]